VAVSGRYNNNNNNTIL